MNQHPRILIVDDEPFNIDYLEQELEDSDYEILKATNGQDALEKVRTDSIDLILLDIMMPAMDGFEVLGRLKADKSTRDIPVIVISAMNDLQSVVRGIKLGAEDYLPKPFEPALLHARISSNIERKSLRDLQGLYLKSLEREFDIAREIQMQFLPAELPKVESWEIAAYFKPAKEVAGDFYDSFSLPDGNVAIIVADVCGKGVGAALFMTLFRSLLRAASTTDHFTREKGTSFLPPSERLEKAISLTNNYVYEIHGDTSMFATIFFGILNPKTGQLFYSNCGAETPLVINTRGITELKKTGPAVGVVPEAKYPIKEIKLEKDDLLLAFTDGIPDTQNAKKEFFGREQLLKVFEKSKFTPASLMKEVEQKLTEFTTGTDQFDDITVMALQRNH